MLKLHADPVVMFLIWEINQYIIILPFYKVRLLAYLSIPNLENQRIFTQALFPLDRLQTKADESNLPKISHQSFLLLDILSRLMTIIQPAI